MSLLSVEFGAEAGERAGGFGSFMGGAGEAFAGTFVVVKAVRECVNGETWLGEAKGDYRLPCCFCHRSMYSF